MALFSNFNSMYVSTFFIWQEMGCDLAPLNYLKRWKSLTQMTTMPATDYSGGETRTVSMFSKLMQQSSSLVMEGVKNLVVKKHNLPGKSTDQIFFLKDSRILINKSFSWNFVFLVTKIVDELMEIKQGSYNEEYLYFDPKILRGQDNIPRAKNPFQVEWFFRNIIIIIINFNCYIDDGLISPPLVHTMGQKI